MTIRFAFSLVLLAAVFAGTPGCAFSAEGAAKPVEAAKPEGDMTPLSKTAATEAKVSPKKDNHLDYEPDSISQLNHEAMVEYKGKKYDVAQHLLEKVVAGLEQEKVSDLSLAEALENLHLALAADSKSKEAAAALEHARAIRKKYHMPPLDPKMVDMLPSQAVRKQHTELAKETSDIVDGHDSLYPPEKLTDKTPEAWAALMATAQHERETGEQHKALANFRKALTIANTFPKPNDKVISSMNMLASVYRNLDKPYSARMLYLECIDLHQKLGKTDSADYATLLDNAGQTFVILHEYNEAQKLLEQAVQIFKKAKGPDNSDLAMTLCNLGEVYLMKKEDQKGEQTIESALLMFRKTLTPEDMRVLITADNLAEVYSKHGKYKEAEELQRTVISTMEKVVGNKGVHPDLCVALNGLAQTLYREKKYSEADPLLRKCIEMNRAIYGDKHPKTLNSIGSYASFLEKTGQKEEADRILNKLTAPIPAQTPGSSTK